MRCRESRGLRLRVWSVISVFDLVEGHGFREMKRGWKIALFILGGIGLCVVALVAIVLYVIYSPEEQHDVSKQAKLSNGGILRVHGREYRGPHGFPYFWDATYRPSSGAPEENAGIWGGGAITGDVVGCPIDDLVVVNPVLTDEIFVRNTAGQWKTITLEIYGKTQSPFGIEYELRKTSLSAEDLEKLHSFFMALGPAFGFFQAQRMQFVKSSRELWADFSTPAGKLETRMNRVRLKLLEGGEHLQLVDIREIPSVKGYILPDREPDPGCTRVYPFETAQSSDQNK